MFRHPSYYKNLRKLARNRKLQEIVDGIAASATDQAISPTRATAPSRRATGPGPKLTRRERGIYKSTALTPGDKQQASSAKLKDPQATSDKHQAPRHKRQA